MTTVKPPASRKDFHVAIICALPREADAVLLLFDQFWDEVRDPYGRADGDPNLYITGRMGEHSIVLVVLPGMGTISAAAAAASFRLSFTELKIAFLVGICGGVPRIDGVDALLGDVVVSNTIIEYDLGQLYPGHFAVNNTVANRLNRAKREIRTLLAACKDELRKERLQEEASRHLEALQEAAKKKRRRRANYRYPGAEEDKLFPPTYTHKHRGGCSVCTDDAEIFCEAATLASCLEAGCDVNNLIARDHSPRLTQGSGETFTPEIFIGRIGSGNTVMKSGEDRDRIAAAQNLIAFEMEGACVGTWNQVQCIVVKGICDYADSHKNKGWQDFAAATAASVMKAILGRYSLPDEERTSTLTKEKAVSSVSQVEKRRPNGRSIAGNSFGDKVWINQGDVTGNVTFT
ncbi:hypothetical protein LB507_005614 [Fusarium sp. FIESC RH6]|nr:hypothetical protein LB507_005614 [Fusarium sp. FIESC RH6]